MNSLFLELRALNTNHNIKLTTVIPYVVTTELAKNPTSRFMFIIPYTTPEETASLTIQAMRTDQEKTFIPTFLRMSFYWFTVLDYLKPRVETD